MADAELRYNFLCPSCSGNFSIQLERIPPVQARFRCPHCKEPMDFPSRDEARVLIQRQAESLSDPPETAAVVSAAATGPGETAVSGEPLIGAEKGQFRVEKPGYQTDVFDRRGIRNLIRTGDVLESDRIRVDDAMAVAAGSVPYLKSLFNLAKEQRQQPPPCCRTHTDRVAFFRCHDTGRPLCEPCAPEKKFGGSTIRVCQHCGGTASDLESLTAP